MPPAADWRADNRVPEDLDIPGFAFEFLRRNRDYARDFRRFGRERRKDVADHLAPRWGLRFRLGSE